MLGGIQLGLLVEARLTAGCWHAVWGAGGCCFASLTVLGGIQLGLLVEVPLCEIGGRVLGACSLGCW